MAVIAHNEAIWRNAEQSAREFINAHLSNRYDMDKAYQMTGEERNPLLIKMIIDITLWYLIHRLPESMGYERREPPYLEARRLLEQIQNGKANINLPLLGADNQSNGQGSADSPYIRGGSMKKNKYDY